MGEEKVDEQPKQRLAIKEGNTSDIDLLPMELGMSSSPDQEEKDDGIKLGSLEFIYDSIRPEIEKGTSRLRVIKDKDRQVIGFSIVTPGKSLHVIKMLWVNQEKRREGLGKRLLVDAINNLPDGEISMDVWGGVPMTDLATSLGFQQNPGGNMTNRWTLHKGSS